METIEHKISIVKLNEDELSDVERKVMEEAKKATERSYSPYSHFSVGAAVLLSSGQIVSGSNQENCAFPSGLCAERTTIFYANANYPDQAVTMLCIAARGTNGEFTEMPVSPCGACRQVLVETEQRFNTPMRVLLYGTEGIYAVSSARDLLPVCFDSYSLI